MIYQKILILIFLKILTMKMSIILHYQKSLRFNSIQSKINKKYIHNNTY